MSRQLIAILFASAIGASSLDSSATAAPASPVQTSAALLKNKPPLGPGGPAGIQRAQGASDRGVLIASGAILAAIVAALLLIEDDDDAVSTGTN